MCFTIDMNHNPEAIVAKKDIRVYKTLEDLHICKGKKNGGKLIGNSPYQNFTWFKGEVVKRKLGVNIRTYNSSIDEGLHAFTTSARAIKNQQRNSSCREICECIIPAGSTYWINLRNEEIVSDTMYWTGRVFTDRWRVWSELKVNKYKFFKFNNINK